jgi:hypothetical protein
MKDTLANKLASFDATIAVADKDEFKPVWQNQPPPAFGQGLAAVRTAVAGLRTASAQQSAKITGAADAWIVAQASRLSPIPMTARPVYLR